MFRTQFDRSRQRSEAGSRIHVLYQLEADRDGVLDLVPVGKENIYEMIQSYKESCDIHVILSRFRNGETDVLNQRIGSFGDVSRMPLNYADYLNISIKGKELFDNLPKDIRKEFGYNYNAFLSQLSDDPKAFAKKVGPDLAAQLGFVAEAAAAGSAPVGVDGAAGSGAEGAGQPTTEVVKEAAANE